MKLITVAASLLALSSLANAIRARSSVQGNNVFDPLAVYYSNLSFASIGSARSLRAVKGPVDPIPGRRHVFVVGPESAGTRLVTRIVGADLGVELHGHQFADENHNGAAVHISLPWGSPCQIHPHSPDVGSQIVDYDSVGNIRTPGNPRRWNLNVEKLIDSYVTHGMDIHIVLVLRDPEISFASKLSKRCTDRSIAMQEQAHAYHLMQQVQHNPHVSTVCYEQLIHDTANTLQALRADLHVTSPQAAERLYDGNAKYALPKPYKCNEMIRTYNRLCPNTALLCE